jgi:hypothetical protein
MQKFSFICGISILCLQGEMQASGWLLLASLVRLPHDLIVGSVYSQKCCKENNFTYLILYYSVDTEIGALQCPTISYADTTNSLTI